MKKLVLFMHTSLDGYVAGPAGEMDWIKVDDEIFDYAGSQTSRADTALYGRVTYQMMESYWPTAADQPGATKHDIEHSVWYNKVNKVVISKTMKGISLPRTIIVSDHIEDQIREMKKGDGKDIVIFGSPGACQILIAENLIDEYWLFVNPVLLGQGIPLFRGERNKTDLKLVLSKAFSSGVVCLHHQLGS